MGSCVICCVIRGYVLHQNLIFLIWYFQVTCNLIQLRCHNVTESSFHWFTCSHRHTRTSQSNLQLLLCLKTLHLTLSFHLYPIHILTLFYTLFIVFIFLIPLYPPTSISFCLFPLFLSLILSALCCLLVSFTLTAASLITIEGWSQLSLFFLTRIYLWELVRPTTWEMNGGSNAIKYSQILYFSTFSQERSRYVGKKVT